MTHDVTVIVCVRDLAAYIGDAIRSLMEGIDPDRLLEIVVVDDGSTDGSADVAEEAEGPIRVIRRRPAGLGPVRNAGLDAAKGEIIGWLDADDLWAAPRPDPRLNLLDADPALDLVRGRELMVVGPPGGPLTPIAPPYHSAGMSATLARRRIYERVRFDETNVLMDDLDWYMRAVDAGVRMAQIEDIVQRYRQRPGSLSRDGLLGHRVVSALRASIVRRRAQP